MKMKHIKNIIFDWDNTIFPFKKYWEIAHFGLFEQFVKFDTNAFMKQYKIFDEILFDKVLSHEWEIEKFRQERLRLTFEHFDLEYDEAFLTDFQSLFFAELFEAIRPDEILLTEMKHLSQDYHIAILTNGKSVEQRTKIRNFGFDGLFPFYISEETGFAKPDIKAFENLLAQENFKPAETLMIGDLPAHDIHPAKKLGLTTAIIGFDEDEQADFRFDNIMQALKKLAQ